VKKKYTVPPKDKNDWIDFTNQIGNLSVKDADLPKKNAQIYKVQKLDLHGYSLSDSNKIVKKFIIESFDSGYKKLLVVTGKGLRSKSYNNPYVSEKLNVLKNSIPDFIQNDEDLKKKIKKISKANVADGGEGAIYIFLKSK